MKAPKVIIVLLRRPSRKPTERRDDPFWEFGSFGCTGCHSCNLMNPKRANELNGARLAFVQGGPQGFRLVYVTPEIWMAPLGSGYEACWPRREMPLSYRTAPLVIDNAGNTGIPELIKETRGIDRHTPVARFSSAFRSRRTPVAGVIGSAIIACYRKHRKPARVAKSYVDAMPNPPPLIERHRRKRYRYFRERQLKGTRSRHKHC